MLDSDGRATTLHEVFGDRVVLLSFVYASCSDVNGCPLATSVMDRVQSRLAADPDLATSVRLVSFSFDLEHDTPAVLEKYAAVRSADRAWTGASSRAGPKPTRPILDAYGQSSPSSRSMEKPAGTHRAHPARVPDRSRAAHPQRLQHLVPAPDTLANDLATVLLEQGARSTPRPPSLRCGRATTRAATTDEITARTRPRWRRGTARAADLIARAACRARTAAAESPPTMPLTAPRSSWARTALLRPPPVAQRHDLLCDVPRPRAGLRQQRDGDGRRDRGAQRPPQRADPAQRRLPRHSSSTMPARSRLEHQVWGRCSRATKWATRRSAT